MKLSKYIKGLQDFLKQNGDMECYYAADDEGNCYSKVEYDASLFFLNKGDKAERNPELCGSEDATDEGIDNFIKVCVVN